MVFMTEIKSKDEKYNSARAEAELRKLNLEIENLKYKNAWENRLAIFIPLISSLLAVGGFLFGIYQFQQRTIAEQQKDRVTKEREQATRIQDQIRTDIDQLLQFPTNKDLSIARVVFILHDLNHLINSSVEQQQAVQENLPGQKRDITKNLVAMISYDCDLNNMRDAEFVFSVLNEWDDYLEYLKSDPDTAQIFLERDVSALGGIHLNNREYVESMKFNAQKGDFIQNEKEDVKLFKHFTSLVLLFKQHLELLEEKSELKTKLIRDFQQETCNPILTEQLFNENFSDVNCSK